LLARSRMCNAARYPNILYTTSLSLNFIVSVKENHLMALLFGWRFPSGEHARCVDILSAGRSQGGGRPRPPSCREMTGDKTHRFVQDGCAGRRSFGGCRAPALWSLSCHGQHSRTLYKFRLLRSRGPARGHNGAARREFHVPGMWQDVAPPRGTVGRWGAAGGYAGRPGFGGDRRRHRGLHLFAWPPGGAANTGSITTRRGASHAEIAARPVTAECAREDCG